MRERKIIEIITRLTINTEYTHKKEFMVVKTNLRYIMLSDATTQVFWVGVTALHRRIYNYLNIHILANMNDVGIYREEECDDMLVYYANTKQPYLSTWLDIQPHLRICLKDYSVY